MRRLSQSTFGTKILIAFLAVIVLTGVLGVFSLIQIRRLDHRTQEIKGTWLPAVKALGNMNAAIWEFRAAQFQHIASADPDAKTRAAAVMDAQLERMGKNVERYEPLIVVEEERRLYDTFSERWIEFMMEHANILALSLDGKAAEATALAQGHAQQLFGAATSTLIQLIDLNDRMAGEVSRKADEESTSARKLVVIVMVVVFAAGLGLGWLVTMSIGRQLGRAARDLRETAEHVVVASSQVSASSKELSNGAMEQAASLQQTSAAMEQVATITRTNAENSVHAVTLMAEVDRAVDDSNQALDSMLGTMVSIRESSAGITRIIDTIDRLAFQTNILALNAAVEAARAGQAGLGFGVVADEVRSLAQRSAQAARETAALVEDSLGRSSEGQLKADHVAASIRTITERASTAKHLIDEVSAASSQQSRGIDQVSEAIAQIARVTQVTTRSARQSAATSSELAAQADVTMAVVGRLEGMVGGAHRRVSNLRAMSTASDGTAASACSTDRPSMVSTSAVPDPLTLSQGTSPARP